MLLRLLTLLSLALSLLTLGAKSQDPKPLHILIWSDYIDPELVKTFEKENNTKVTLDVYEETEAMLAKLAALKGASKGEAGGGGYDLVVASDHAVPVLDKLGLLQKLDPAKIPNTKNIDPRFLKPAYDPAGNLSTPYQWGTLGLLYNKKKLPTPPTATALLSGHAPGKFILLDSPRDTLALALRVDGKSINTRSPADLKAAGKHLATAKADPNFIAFDGSVSACKRVIAGQADIALAYNGDALNAMKDLPDGGGFDYIVPPEGTLLWVDTMVIPSNAPNPDGAHTFMNFILDPDHGAALSNYINYATPNTAALPKINPSAKSDPRIYAPDDLVKKLNYLEDVGAATRLYDEVWTAVKAQ